MASLASKPVFIHGSMSAPRLYQVTDVPEGTRAPTGLCMSGAHRVYVRRYGHKAGRRAFGDINLEFADGTRARIVRG